MVGQLHAAGERVAGPRSQSRPAAQFDRARQGHHFYWDESLHGEIRSTWSYAAGPALTLLEVGLPMLGLLVVFSFSRRSGPVRDLPAPARAAPIEFLEALGSLYRNAGAASTAVAIAWNGFRRQALRLWACAAAR